MSYYVWNVKEKKWEYAGESMEEVIKKIFKKAEEGG